MRQILVVLLVQLVVQSAQAGLVLSEDFETGSVSGWSLTGLWKVTQNAPADGIYALGYVKDEVAGATPDGNFDTGARNSGSATTPSVSCMTGLCEVSFDWFDISEDGIYDIFDVVVVPSAGPEQIIGANLDAIAYENFSQDVSTIVGTDPFALRFDFDTLDGVINNLPGVRVDNLQIIDSSMQATVPTPATVCLLGLGLLGLRMRLKA